MKTSKYFAAAIFLLLAIFIGLNIGIGHDSENQDPAADEYRNLAKQFSSKLLGVLTNEIKEGGNINAVNVCYNTAQNLTRDFGLEKGVLIKRVTFKNRNPLNVPDNFEKGILRKFEHMKFNGELNSSSEYFKIVHIDGKKYARYMKPIMVMQLCINCHGDESTMAKDVIASINSKYENDKARDYKVGDLRGAISIIKEIE